MFENNESVTQNANVYFQLRAIGKQLKLLFRTYNDLKDEVNLRKQHNNGVDRWGNTIHRAIQNVKYEFKEFVDENIDASENDYYFASTS